MLMLARTPSRDTSSESGFAAIVIAIVMVLVLSLTTLGFSQLVRDEQDSATDKHLSSQAYYNAESGINDAAKAINEGFNQPKKKCGPITASDPGVTLPAAKYLVNNSVGTDGNSYTCLLINPNPLSLEYSSVDDSESTTVTIGGVNPLNPDEHKQIGKIVISWKQTDGGAGRYSTSGITDFNPAAGAGSWNFAPVLRISMTPLETNLVNRDSMISNTLTSFLYPAAGAANSQGAINNTVNEQGIYSGRVVSGSCNDGNDFTSDETPQPCNVAITNPDPHANYVLNMRSIYGKSRVSIHAFDTAGLPMAISNAQTVIDSTGKAQDVYRRVQVRIPSKDVSNHPDYGIEAAGGICKQLQLLPGAGSKNDCTP